MHAVQEYLSRATGPCTRIFRFLLDFSFFLCTIGKSRQQSVVACAAGLVL